MIPPWCFCSLWLALLVSVAAANVEKAIFVAGEEGRADVLDELETLMGLLGAMGMETDDVTEMLPDLRAREALFTDLTRLTATGLSRLVHDAPANAWRTHLPAAFPWAETYPVGATTWVRLDALHPEQRYEVRVCWAATQPTAFAVDVYDAATVIDTPELADDLRAFLDKTTSDTGRASSAGFDTTSPYALLRLVATADFVAADPAHMPASGIVPPVLVDIILDPYLLNVLPRSLVPTVGVVVCVAALSTWLATAVVRPWLRRVATNDEGQLQDKKKA